MQLGAFDFLTKPFSADHLTVVVKKALATVALHRQVDVLRQEVDDRYDHLVGANAKIGRATHDRQTSGAVRRDRPPAR